MTSPVIRFRRIASVVVFAIAIEIGRLIRRTLILRLIARASRGIPLLPVGTFVLRRRIRVPVLPVVALGEARLARVPVLPI